MYCIKILRGKLEDTIEIKHMAVAFIGYKCAWLVFVAPVDLLLDGNSLLRPRELGFAWTSGSQVRKKPKVQPP